VKAVYIMPEGDYGLVVPNISGNFDITEVSEPVLSKFL